MNNNPKCERCAKYGNPNSEMRLEKIEPLQVKEKMKYGKIKGYSYLLVYIGYNYFVCPICGWFKFVKKPKIINAKVEGYDGQ